jgi:hydrogenase nickel incorporation protein HypB
MTKKIVLQKNILSKNDEIAASLRKVFDDHHIRAINIMASPGSGKTSLISHTLNEFKHDYSIAVIDGDIVDLDLKKIQSHQVQTVLANTGGACHLDAVMMNKAVQEIDLQNVDLLIVENVGNLICPANFKLGTHVNVVVSSVPEGDDKPVKYPSMFKGADVVILNKIDYLEIEDFDTQKFSRDVQRINPTMELFFVSCKTGEGLKDWFSWLRQHELKQ